MARRGVENNFRRSVNTVAAQEGISTSKPLEQTVAEIGQKIIVAGQQAKINENFSNAQLEVNQLNRQFQIDFESDPFNKEGLALLKQNTDVVFKRNSQGISPFFKKPYNDMTRDLAKKSEAAIESFGFVQTRKNTVTSINKSIKNNLSQAAIDGASGVDLATALLNFSTSKQALVGTADGILGESEATELFETFDDDYLKTFLSAKADIDPIGALQLMEQEGVEDQFVDKKEFLDMKTAVESKALNVGKNRAEREVLTIMTGANSLLFQSEERPIPYAELQQRYAENNVSKPAQKLINKINGYTKAPGDILSDEQKVQFNIDLFNDLAALEGREGVTTEEINAIQDRVYEGMGNKALTKREGISAIGELLEPSVASIEKSLESFSRDTWLPFDEIGFKRIKKKFDKDFEIDKEDSSLSKSKLNKVNNLNRLRLYQSYNQALISLMPEGVPIADINTLPFKERGRILGSAQKLALDAYAFETIGRQAQDGDTEQDVMNAINGEQENNRRSAAQDVINKAYDTAPAGGLQSFDSEEALNAANLPIGTRVIVNGVTGTVN